METSYVTLKKETVWLCEDIKYQKQKSERSRKYTEHQRNSSLYNQQICAGEKLTQETSGNNCMNYKSVTSWHKLSVFWECSKLASCNILLQIDFYFIGI